MNEDIKRILGVLKENYEEIGLGYYPCDLLKCKDPKIIYDYIINLQEENQKLKQWDNNKDSRNSRQRVANAKLLEKNQHLKDRINKALEKLDSFIECCKCEKLESGSDYLHHQYWNMFEDFNKQVKDILKGGKDE